MGIRETGYGRITWIELISKCKAHCLALLEESGKKFGCLDPFSTYRLLKELCGVEVTGMGWVGLAWLVYLVGCIVTVVLLIFS